MLHNSNLKIYFVFQSESYMRENNLEDLKHIRSMMERSSKFLSLSGISGVAAGSVALCGALIAYLRIGGILSFTDDIVTDFILIALVVLVLAGSLGFYFSIKRAKKIHSNFWLPGTKQILTDFTVPMVVGGLFCLVLIYQHAGLFVGSAMLVFYGLALLTAGSRTYRDIKILGVCQIILGLLAGCFIGYGLYFWAFGFGVLHIVYGIVMYLKYDKKDVQV